MDFVDRLRELASRIPNLKSGDLLRTEEATKNALIMPFIQALGYDVFNPLEVTPELVADVGTKKGEKVDYAILKDNAPIILFECKAFGADLGKVQASQLYRYFSVTSARFGILTNGIIYRFHSDLTAANKMDDAPFFVFDLTSFNDSHIETLKRFAKSSFDVDSNVQIASNLKYRNAVKIYLETLFTEPSEGFIGLVVKESKAYEGRVTQGVIGEFQAIIKEAFSGIIRDLVDKRLKSALASSEAADEKPLDTMEEADEDDGEKPEESKIITTQEELDGYFAVKSIVREVIDAKRVTFRDAQSYASILVDDNNRKLLCRLHFNRSKKYVGVFDDDKNEERHPIESIDDIYNLAEQLKATATRLL